MAGEGIVHIVRKINGVDVAFIEHDNPLYCGIVINPELAQTEDITQITMLARAEFKSFYAMAKVAKWVYTEQSDKDLIEHAGLCRRVIEQDSLVFADEVIDRAKSQFKYISAVLEQRRIEHEEATRFQGVGRGKFGYVYLIRSASGHYKIGRTKDPKNRMKTFGIQLPFEVEYLCLIETVDMKALEMSLHEQFASKRVNGEWFALDAEDVEYIKDMAS